MKPKGLIIAGTQSSSGKTAVVSMILAALKQRGYPVQPFKVGPDFIDPGYHRIYSGKGSVNLDAWIMGEKEVRRAAQSFTENAIGIAEGVMGLFDGANPDNDEGSSYEISSWLNWPILLVVPCSHMGRSVVASIRGFLKEDGRGRIVGVILNQLGSEGHSAYLRNACVELEVPLLGMLPKVPELEWPERHLGLKSSTEDRLPPLERLAEIAEQYIDVKRMLSLIQSPKQKKDDDKNQSNRVSTMRIGLAQDEAFHFYYHANLEWLRGQGAEVIPFSPLRDFELPEKLNGLILGGGFPEVFARQVSSNHFMRMSLKKAIGSGMPCYAECGGLMLLAQYLETKEGESFPMVGALPGKVKMGETLQNFGYCMARQVDGTIFRGHEFHHSSWMDESQQANAWKVTRHATGNERREGFRKEALHASYVHLYFPKAESLLSGLFGT